MFRQTTSATDEKTEPPFLTSLRVLVRLMSNKIFSHPVVNICQCLVKKKKVVSYAFIDLHKLYFIISTHP